MSHIYFIAGAPAVGKSTTARALALQFQKSIHIPVDNIREMVVSGVIHPSGNWSQELIEQLALARQNVTQMAITYREAGFMVVIDDFWDPYGRLQEYAHLFQEPNVHKILLFPSQKIAEERNLKRSGSVEASQYIADGIRSVYKSLETDAIDLENQGWIIADTTDKTVEETVQHILVQVRGVGA